MVNNATGVPRNPPGSRFGLPPKSCTACGMVTAAGAPADNCGGNGTLRNGTVSPKYTARDQFAAAAGAASVIVTGVPGQPFASPITLILRVSPLKMCNLPRTSSALGFLPILMSDAAQPVQFDESLTLPLL